MKGSCIASASYPELAAVFLSSSPGERQRPRGRGSKGEAFVTRSFMNTPLQAKPVPRHRGRRVTGQGEGLRKTAARQRRTEAHRNRRAASAPPAAGRSDQMEVQRAQARCARDAQGGRRPSPKGMSAKARTWSSPTAAKPVGRPTHRETSSPHAPASRWPPEEARHVHGISVGKVAPRRVPQSAADGTRKCRCLEWPRRFAPDTAKVPAMVSTICNAQSFGVPPTKVSNIGLSRNGITVRDSAQ